MSKKTLVITGANRGIGLSLAKHYQKHGWDVYALCRRASDEMNTVDMKIIDGVDVSSEVSIAAMSSQLKNINIDLLVNNAGILRDEVFGNLDYPSIESQFTVNTLGPLRITEALNAQLNDHAKIAMITSRMGSITDNTSGGRYGYRMSKAALNIAAVSLARDLAHRHIAVGIYHPGLVGTAMIGGHGDVTPDQAAERLAVRIAELNMARSGQFFHANGESLPW